MKEIEVKFLVDSFDETRIKLSKSGFSKTGSFTERVCYYDSCDGKWDDKNITIRTKEIDGKIIFTAKRKMDGEFKNSIEKECEIIDSKKEFRGALEIIGFIPDLEYSKTREHFKRSDGCSVELDYIEEIGSKFIELEAESEGKMRELIKELSFEGLTPDLRSYPQIIRQHRRVV